ncbi:MAG: PEP-CTERM sorting domain-containing protein [Kiritimatiellales bacterium]|nr:PEP-CTERM sorting domain-containing protein [Kiritimatiellales bacterium]
MKTKWIILLTAVWVASLPLSSSALLVTRGYSNTTTDNDNDTKEDASSSTASIGASSSTLSSEGSSSGNMGYRFVGQAAAHGTGYLTQSINVTATWTVAAEDWEEYSVNFSPSLAALLNIYDWSTDETDDQSVFPSLSSTLRVNGSVVSDTLDGLTGYTRTTDGSYNLNRSDSQTLSGYTGNNTFSLQLTGTVVVDAHADGGLFDNPTGNAVLWGQNGTLNFADDPNFDNYSTTAALDADGLFVDANITLDAVPEPASALMLVVGAGLIGFIRRVYPR